MVRECHEYNPRILEIPKEHQQRLLKAGDITAQELAAAEQQAEELRRQYFRQPLRPVLDVVRDATHMTSGRTMSRVVILGDPGSGKSSLIRYLALRWATVDDPAPRDAQPVPLVIDLASYDRWQARGLKDLVRFLEEGSSWFTWPPGLLGCLLQQPGGVVVLLDGLDEIFDTSARDLVLNDIQRFCGDYPRTPIVVTSRWVGYQPQRLRDVEFRHFMLHDLEPKQIGAFIDRWHEHTIDEVEQAASKRERLKKAIDGSHAIGMLAGNPLLLTMMAILNRSQELPRRRADLYDNASRVLLQIWDTERALINFPGLADGIGWQEKHDMLRRIASFMQLGPGGLKGNMIAGAELTRLIEEYLRVELRVASPRAVARAVVEQLRQRNFILCFVGADTYRFIHRTFLEYFCAVEIVDQFNRTKTLNESDLIALFERHGRDDDWREVLRLICGQIDEQVVGRIIEHLIGRTDLALWDGEESLPEVLLAMECLSERGASRGWIRWERCSSFGRSTVSCGEQQRARSLFQTW